MSTDSPGPGGPSALTALRSRTHWHGLAGGSGAPCWEQAVEALLAGQKEALS
jgi:hypothetical protein